MYTTKKHFRSDIEGLRAVAILLVAGAHFSVPGFAAGFIGVDIFFVLSGFLITGILVREHQQNSRIDLMRFYANRLRRLFPALAAMLIVVGLAARWILPETQNLAQSHAAAMAAFWVSNIHFTFADPGYFAAETSGNLFLHTWSLGVEEQFYLLWPLLILLAMGLPATYSQKSPSIWLVLLPIAITSFVTCLYMATTNPSFAFYMMPTRAWQFAAGGMVWLLSQNVSPNESSARISSAIACIMLIAAMLFISPATPYPSFLALIPTLAACALLWAGSSGNALPTRLLSKPAMQWLGRLSYAWYLWHWPVLLLAKKLGPGPSDIVTAAGAAALSLLLAIATHYLIERPIRFGKLRQLAPRWQIGAAVVLMVLINSQMLRWYTQTDLVINTQLTKYTNAISDLPSFYHDNCDNWYTSDKLKPCRYGSPSAAKTVVLLGDSIGAQWFPALKEIYHPDEWAIIVLTKAACPMVDEPYFYPRIGREYTECSSWRGKAIDWIIDKKPDVVFIGSTISYAFNDQQLNAGTRRTLDKLTRSLATLYLIEANPILGFNGPECLIQNYQSLPEKCAATLDTNIPYVHAAAVLKPLISDYKRLHWIETASLVCPKGRCAAENENGVIFRDSQHVTASFAASAAEQFKQQIVDEQQ